MNIGVTGHRHLADPAGWVWVQEMIARELDAFPPPLVAVTSLAVGADQMLASLVIAHGGRVRAVLPFADYGRTFAVTERILYERLLAASEVEILRTPGADEDAYQAAGYSVAAYSDVLIAVWDGSPARGKGGTGDVVTYAMRKHVPVIHLNPITRAIIRYGEPAEKA